MSLIPAGNYKARARATTAEEALGESKQKKTKFVKLTFVITDGEWEGQTVSWDGYFGERSTKRTIESLRFCGVDGDDIADLSNVSANIVDIVVEHEKWTPTEGERAGEEQTRARVAWVNGGSGIPEEQRLAGAKLAAFRQQMKGAMAATKPARATPNAGPAKTNGSSGAGASSRGAESDAAAVGSDIPFICSMGVEDWQRP